MTSPLPPPPPPPAPPAPPAARVVPHYWAPSSPGDLADRWTILAIRVARAEDEAARQAATLRIQGLCMPGYDDTSASVMDALGRINERLWDLEDEVRRLAAAPQTADTQARFLQAARSIPILNDTRAHLKSRIDELMGHAAQDVKMYRP